MTDDTGPDAFARIHRDELVALTLDLLSKDTSNPPGDTRDIVELVASRLDKHDVDFERFAVDPAKPNLLASLSGVGDRTLLFNGHLDTVSFDAGEWSRDPLGEHVGDRIYGRGATDMKGSLAAMVSILVGFAEAEERPPLDLRFAFVSDEEVGGDAGLSALLDAGKLEADACAIGEPTCEEGRYSVTVADRGSIWLTVEATGEAAHGSRPMLGDNAIDRLYDAITTLRKQFGNRVLDLDASMRPILAESIEYYAPTMGADAARELFENPSINLGTIDGGEAINSVPQSARAELDIRLTAGVDTPEVLAGIRDCIANCEGITLADVSWSVGTVESLESPLVEAVASTAEAVAGERVYRRSATGGGDAKQLRNAGIPTVEFAFGTDTLHGVDEFTTVEALEGNAAVYSRLPAALATGAE